MRHTVNCHLQVLPSLYGSEGHQLRVLSLPFSSVSILLVYSGLHSSLPFKTLPTRFLEFILVYIHLMMSEFSVSFPQQPTKVVAGEDHASCLPGFPRQTFMGLAMEEVRSKSNLIDVWGWYGLSLQINHRGFAH